MLTASEDTVIPEPATMFKVTVPPRLTAVVSGDNPLPPATVMLLLTNLALAIVPSVIFALVTALSAILTVETAESFILTEVIELSVIIELMIPLVFTWMASAET